MEFSVTLINHTDHEFEESLFDNLAAMVLSEEHIPETSSGDAEIGLILCSGNEIRELNRKFRGQDEKTDVLSFKSDYPNIPQLGDIIIDIERANEQKGNMSLNYEVQILFLHGLLHLLGYDHISQKQQREMRAIENKYQRFIKEFDK